MKPELDQAKITAYALGELSDAEARTIVGRLSEEDIRFISEIQQTAALLTDELRSELHVVSAASPSSRQSISKEPLPKSGLRIAAASLDAPQAAPIGRNQLLREAAVSVSDSHGPTPVYHVLTRPLPALLRRGRWATAVAASLLIAAGAGAALLWWNAHDRSTSIALQSSGRNPNSLEILHSPENPPVPDAVDVLRLVNTVADSRIEQNASLLLPAISIPAEMPNPARTIPAELLRLPAVADDAARWKLAHTLFAHSMQPWEPTRILDARIRGANRMVAAAFQPRLPPAKWQNDAQPPEKVDEKVNVNASVANATPPSRPPIHNKPKQGDSVFAPAMPSSEDPDGLKTNPNAQNGDPIRFHALWENDQKVSAGWPTTSNGDAGPQAPGAFLSVARHPLSTFSMDVFPTDPVTAVSVNPFAEIERDVNAGTLPPPQAVRAEQLLNAFTYEYPLPKAGAAVASRAEVAACPWNRNHRLVSIAIKARDAAPGDDLTASDTPIIARDVKVAVNFNAARVSAYRLIGYEEPLPNAASADLSVGADLPAGRGMIALYELVPAEAADARPIPDPKSQPKSPNSAKPAPPASLPATRPSNALLTLKVHYQLPNQGDRPASDVDMELPVDDGPVMAASADFQFASAVAAFSLMLRNSPDKPDASWDRIIEWAQAGAGDESHADRHDFLALARKIKALAQRASK